jgi:hypothetical protein
MSAAPNEIAICGHAVTAVLHAGFVGYLLLSKRLRDADRRSSAALVGALLATTVWTLLVLASLTRSQTLSADLLTWFANAVDVIRYSLWFVFLLTLFGPLRASTGRNATLALRVGATLCVAAAAAVLLWRAAKGLEGGFSKAGCVGPATVRHVDGGAGVSRSGRGLFSLERQAHVRGLGLRLCFRHLPVL